MGETLLVELLTEELPPKSLIKLSESFAASIFGILRSNNLLVESANFQHYETPRRLAVVVTNVLKLSKEKEREVKLVPKSIGFDRNGKPTKSLLKKMEALNLKTRLIDSIYSQRLGSVDMLFVNTKPAETPLDRCLSQGIELAIRNLPAPKLMTYQTDDGVTSVKFIRPVRGILAIHGSTSLQLNCLGLDSHDSTAGHRFLCKNRIVINNANEYEDKLEQEGKVIVDSRKRKSDILIQCKSIASRLGLNMGEDFNEELLDEVTALIEKPTVYTAQFREQFLSLPAECLILTMTTNQKYFPLFDSEYKLTNRFLIISNINLENPKNIIEGNQRVIMPRLKDAEFFYEIDRRQSLHSRIPMLKKVLFQNKLGTQYERIMRLHSLSGLIAGILKYDKVNAQRAGLLCKVDLLTEMVGEFPLLQGIMGKYYAHNDEEADLVCDAIQEHYLPRFHGDSIPSAEISVCVALADKIDLLIGIFGIGLEPTGEKDPYALRRAGLGIARIIIENDIEIDLLRLLDLGVKNLSGKIKEPNIARNVFRFIIDRIRTYMKEKQFLSDEIEAVIRKQPKKINDLLRKVDATRQFKESDHFSKLAASNKRIEKIIKNNLPEDKEINISLFKTEAERNLHRKIIDVSSKVKELNLSKKFRGVFTLVATLNPEIDDFFDKVLVMDENPEKRKNNFILLSELHRLLNNVAFLSELN